MDLPMDGKIKYCNIDSLDSEHEFKTLIKLSDSALFSFYTF